MKQLIRVAFAISAVLSLSVYSVTVQVSESPQTNLALTLTAIKSAKKNLRINIYEMTSPEIADAIVDKINHGVSVSLLVEGEPVGGFKSESLAVQQRLIKAMNKSSQADHHYFLMRGQPGHDRRFRFDHAKYVVVDNAALLIASENFSRNGNPPEGQKGTRGWGTIIESNSIAAEYASLFRDDSSLAFHDVEEITTDTRWLNFLNSFLWQLPSTVDTELSRHDDLLDGMKRLEAPQISSISSPTTSRQGLLDLINGSRKTLDIELMSFNSKWGNTGKISPLILALKSAAARGVRIRLLLNDDSVFGAGLNKDGTRKKLQNRETAQLLNDYAEQGNFDLEARIANLKKMKVVHIHNKGMLVDGHLSLVSSINWNQNSIENNRETAVILDSEEVFAHYVNLFDGDWTNSAYYTVH